MNARTLISHIGRNCTGVTGPRMTQDLVARQVSFEGFKTLEDPVRKENRLLQVLAQNGNRALAGKI